MDRSEGFGEWLLGALLDRAQELPPQLINPMVAEEAARIGGREVCILLQDYGQRELRPLPGRGLVTGEPERIDGSVAGRAFLRRTVVAEQRDDGVRMYLPLLDGSDVVGVLALTVDTVDDDDRRLLRRLAGLVADMLVTKNSYRRGGMTTDDATLFLVEWRGSSADQLATTELLPRRQAPSRSP